MEYPPEVAQAMRAIREVQHDRSPAFFKDIRTGAHLCSVRRYLDDDAFIQWVEGDLGISLHLARHYMEIALSITPEPLRREWLTPTGTSTTGQRKERKKRVSSRDSAQK